MLIVYRKSTGEIVDNTGINSHWPEGPPGEIAYVNTDNRGIERSKLALLRLHDEDDKELVYQALSNEVIVDPSTGKLVVGDPLPAPEPTPPPEEPSEPTPADDTMTAMLFVARNTVKEKLASDSFPLSDAAQVAALFPTWDVGVDVSVGEIYIFNNELVEVLQAHTTQSDWTPDVTPALWKIYRDPEAVTIWVQPTGAHDSYSAGEAVSHNGVTYTSDVDGNVWEPPTQWTAL